VLIGLSRRDNLLILLKVLEVSLPMHSILHGATISTGSPAGIFHFQVLAEQSEKKLSAQNSGRVMRYHAICFRSVNRGINFPVNTFKHSVFGTSRFMWNKSWCHILF